MKSKSQKGKHRYTLRQQKYELICRSNTREIRCIERFIKKINLKLHLDDGSLYRLLVSCTEAVNNAITHGNKLDPNKKIIIQCIANKKILTVRVKDEGKGFDSEVLPDPRDEKNLLKENGRGVFLMRSLMDKVVFKRLKKGSLVEMTIILH
jgi:serine/threonine-protein kinase RsbW